MAMMKVSLDIGFPSAIKEDIIEVDNDDLNACETDDEKDELLLEHWTEWAWNYINSGYELIED